jgi:ABC-2 type transport system ATP-binding protein
MSRARGPGRARAGIARVLSVQGLVRSFGGRTVVDGLSFEVEPGQIVALLGPNGAGKTTSLRMIAGVLEPDAGEVSLFGMRMWRDRIGAQSFLGYLPEGAPLWRELSARATLAFLADVRGMGRRERDGAIDQALEALALRPVADWPVEALSKGFRRRVALAGVLLHDPRVLVLDEPTDGLDPNQKRETRELIRALAPGRVIVISTHVLEEAEALCGRALVIHQGRIVADASPAQLAASVPGGRLDDAFAALTGAGSGAGDSASAPAGLEPVP